ncbi:MAG: branched-chain amino acid transport system permease protein [Glaciecola sp.]|jgi:branched-chain amino acid transport system permease protein
MTRLRELANEHRDLAVLLVGVLLLLPVGFLVDGPNRTAAVRVLYTALFGVAWNMMAGFGGHFSFGHAAYFGIGAYTGAVLLVNHGVSPWIGMVVGAVVAVCFAVATAFASFHYKLKGAYFALSTFAFAEMLRLITQSQPWLNEARGFNVPIVSGDSWWMLQFKQGSVKYYLVVLALLAVAQFAVLRLMSSKTGLFILAVREDEDAAAAAGIDPMRYKLISVAVSAAITAVTGVFVTQFLFFVDPDLAFGGVVSVAILLPAIVGGVGTTWGPIVGAGILVPLGEVTRSLVRNPPPGFDFLQGRSGLDQIIYALLLVFIILYLPKGVFGSLAERARSRS